MSASRRLKHKRERNDRANRRVRRRYERACRDQHWREMLRSCRITDFHQLEKLAASADFLSFKCKRCRVAYVAAAVILRREVADCRSWYDLEHLRALRVESALGLAVRILVPRRHRGSVSVHVKP